MRGGQGDVVVSGVVVVDDEEGDVVVGKLEKGVTKEMGKRGGKGRREGKNG